MIVMYQLYILLRLLPIPNDLPVQCLAATATRQPRGIRMRCLIHQYLI